MTVYDTCSGGIGGGARSDEPVLHARLDEAVALGPLASGRRLLRPEARCLPKADGPAVRLPRVPGRGPLGGGALLPDDEGTSGRSSRFLRVQRSSRLRTSRISAAGVGVYSAQALIDPSSGTLREPTVIS